MADSKLSDLATISLPVLSTDQLYFARAGGSYKATVADLPAGSFSWATAPASASAAGTAGDIAYDGFYFYICIATNTWARTAMGTWA